MIKNSYLVMSFEDEQRKCWAMVTKVPHSNNLVSFLGGLKNLKTANICDAKREAIKIRDSWNNEYKRDKKFPF